MRHKAASINRDGPERDVGAADRMRRGPGIETARRKYRRHTQPGMGPAGNAATQTRRAQRNSEIRTVESATAAKQDKNIPRADKRGGSAKSTKRRACPKAGEPTHLECNWGRKPGAPSQYSRTALDVCGRAGSVYRYGKEYCARIAEKERVRKCARSADLGGRGIRMHGKTAEIGRFAAIRRRIHGLLRVYK